MSPLASRPNAQSWATTRHASRSTRKTRASSVTASVLREQPRRLAAEMDIDERAGHDAHAQGQTGGAADLVPLFDENLVFAILRALEFVGGSGESRRRRAARRIFDSAGAKQSRMDRAVRRDRVGRIEIEARGGGENLRKKRGRRTSAFERGARADGTNTKGAKAL